MLASTIANDAAHAIDDVAVVRYQCRTRSTGLAVAGLISAVVPVADVAGFVPGSSSRIPRQPHRLHLLGVVIVHHPTTLRWYLLLQSPMPPTDRTKQRRNRCLSQGGSESK